jgi:hypothetical protein
MLPAASDDLIRQHNRLPEDDNSFEPDQNRTILEHEPSAKGKKKKSKKNKVARALTETPLGDMYVSGIGAEGCRLSMQSGVNGAHSSENRQSAVGTYISQESLSFPDPEHLIERHVNPIITSPVLDVFDSLDEPAIGHRLRPRVGAASEVVTRWLIERVEDIQDRRRDNWVHMTFNTCFLMNARH